MLGTVAEVTLTAGGADEDPLYAEFARPLEDEFMGVAFFEPGAVDADSLDVELEGEFARMALFDSPRSRPETVMLHRKWGCCIVHGDVVYDDVTLCMMM